MKYRKNILLILIPVLIVFGVVQTLVSLDMIDGYIVQILIVIGINIILAVSLNMVLGYTGQLALGHAGFMSVGGYTAAILTLKLGLPFFVVLIMGGAVAALFGLLIGIPTLRLKGDYLAITTLGFGEIIRIAIVNSNTLGGAEGLAGIPKKTSFATVFFITVFIIIVAYNIKKSSYGRAMLSIREDELASSSVGINTTKYKMIAFVTASFFAGIAGGLYAHYFMFLDPKSFDYLKSFDIVTYVVFGGMGSISGCILSTTILTSLPEILRPVANYRMVIYSAALVLLMIFRPEGVFGMKEISFKRIINFIKRKILFKKGGKYDVPA
ncbi:branched-chain amino acid ABC transporter permease [Clostridium sp. WILCCON 0269]|uniref:Branched-chain amino acid ABC transporter permease n=1 Tax=Candidatus Clostridium eludens TaxID=3381663 RepID=A0ABW8SFW3_9CLOT